VLLGDREIVDVQRFLMGLPFEERTALLVTSILTGDNSEDIACAVFSLVGAATRIAQRISNPEVAAIAATRLRESADCLVERRTDRSMLN
jgi:hypothetical protein